MSAPLRLSGCIETLFAAEHADYPARIRACHAAGLDAVGDALEETWAKGTGVGLTCFSVEPAGLAGIGARVSAINCFEVSSKQTTGRSGSRGL